MKANELENPAKMGAGCLIVSKEDRRFLLIKRSEYVPAPNLWSIPGGKVDPGETPIQAAIRETKEEVGFDVGDRELSLVYVNKAYAPRFTYYTYVCLVEKEFKPVLNWESSEFIWATLDDLPENLHTGTKQLFAYDAAAVKINALLSQRDNA